MSNNAHGIGRQILTFEFYNDYDRTQMTKTANDISIQTETLEDFYHRTQQEVPLDLLNGSRVGHFNVKQSSAIARRTPYNRRDYFKICLSIGTGPENVLRYNGQEIALQQPCLIFTNPSVPASIESRSSSINRFYCLFDNRFIDGYMRPDIQYTCALFNPTLHPVISLTEEEKNKLTGYFIEMQSLLTTDYPFKSDMIRSLLLLLIHEGIRLQQSRLTQFGNGISDRVVNGFFQLLNQQFPVDSPENPLKPLSPSWIADQLHVHVNHLNSVIKKHTGKTTRDIIHERVISEAKTLLRNTDWNIAEIAYALGFDYPSHFNKYFKQLTSATPMEFRAGLKVQLA
jgi:AraC-like DNA-binding protein